jgi:hypothetical protein
MSIRKETGVTLSGAGAVKSGLRGDKHKDQWVYTDTEGTERYFDSKRDAVAREKQDIKDNAPMPFGRR